MAQQREIDELFGGGEGAPEPRTLPAIALAVLGVVVAIIGMICLSAPGGVLVLLGLWWIEREHDRIENGYLNEDARPAVRRARNIVFLCLAVVIGLFFLQAFLYCGGFYQGLGDWFFLGDPFGVGGGTPTGGPGTGAPTITPAPPAPGPAPAPAPPLPPVP